MQLPLIVEFTKMNGAGNDFIVLDNRFFRFGLPDLSHIAITYCARRFGIGADGLLALEDPSDDTCDVRMRYINADGSVGTMCGNGARCLVRFAQQAGFDADPLVIQTDAGVYRAEAGTPDSPVKLWLPPPFPGLTLKEVAVDVSQGEDWNVFPVWTGTEHAVCFVPGLDGIDVDSVGRSIRNHPKFAPAGVNVDFVHVNHDDVDVETAIVEVRTFEKGVEAETLACGTGAVASAIVASSRYFPRATRIEVRMPGGNLNVGIARNGREITALYLEGPATVVYRGTLEYRGPAIAE